MNADGELPASRSETVYAHHKRWDWICRHLHDRDRIIELGCGTGWMLTLPLLRAGYDVTGVDRDAASIDYGRQLATRMGLDASRLYRGDLGELADGSDVIIASEVLEHLDDAQLGDVLAEIHRTLRPGGLLLVTVPNGYGWYEFEAFVWNRLGLGWLLAKTRLERTLMRVKVWLTGRPEEQFVEPHPSSLDTSPHLQRFTLRSLQRTVDSAGFRVLDKTGSGVFAGQLSNLLFTGYDRLTAVNAALADRWPTIAAGFYLACEKPQATAAAPDHSPDDRGRQTTRTAL